MFEIRIHGRGGQGVVTLAELIASAAYDEGRQAQAFPSFGSERMGSPVASFCRIADAAIRVREPVTTPDAVIICDTTLLHQIAVFDGLQPNSIVLLNSTYSPSELGLDELVTKYQPARLRAVPATVLARRFTGRSQPNAALLGAFAALSGLISLPTVESVLRRRFGAKVAPGNIAAATEAFSANTDSEVLSRG